MPASRATVQLSKTALSGGKMPSPAAEYVALQRFISGAGLVFCCMAMCGICIL